MGVSLYRLCVLNAFGGRAESDMDSGHVFPLAVRIAISLAESGPGGRGARVGAGCEAELSLCSNGGGVW